MNIGAILEAATVIPVIELPTLEDAAPLATALAAGGVRVAELTLRTSCALDAIAEMKDAAPDMFVGMGTIRNGDDVKAALTARADFLVSPGADALLLETMASSGAASLPGVATASEAMTAYAAGFKAMKFFPAEAAGGAPYLKSLFGPLPDIVFCPTGSITVDAAPTYLALPNVACVGGSWVAPKAAIEQKNWHEIEANARRAAALG